jgi:hypothetical protein
MSLLDDEEAKRVAAADKQMTAAEFRLARGAPAGGRSTEAVETELPTVQIAGTNAGELGTPWKSLFRGS